MRKAYLFISFFGVLLFSCSQNHENVIESEDVYVRVENTTPNIFDSTAVGNVGYGLLTSAGVTEYKLMPFPVYGAGCSFKVNNLPVQAGMGLCGTPPPPKFKGGYYTFKVRFVQGNPSFYDVSAIKDR